MSAFQFKPESVISTDRRFLSRDTPTPKLLEAIGVNESMREWLRVLDRQGDLALVHYLTTVDENGETNEAPMSLIGHARGIIVDEITGEIVCRSYPYTPEVPVEKLSTFGVTFTDDVTMYPACEGTVLRLYWADGWKISTHRKIEAESSFWAGPSFGSMFREIIPDDFYDHLNKDYCYSFLMSHDANRLLYTVPTPQFLLVCVYDRQARSFLSELPRISGCKMPTQLSVSDAQDLKEQILGREPSFDFTGVIMVSDPTNPTPVKVVSQEYLDLRWARGNEPRIRDRYIQLRGKEESRLLVEWFSEEQYQQIFAEAEKEFERLVARIHGMYMSRYIGKNFGQLPKEEFVTVQRCHEWHCQDRKNNIVTSARVKEFLNETPNYYILIMLNRQREL